MDRIEENVEEKNDVENKKDTGNLLSPEQVEILLKEKEKEVTKAVQEEMRKEIDFLRQRCDFILQNEQVRASYMLREAHRERQEKIKALQTQLQCKNLAGMMYVMCSEREKCKMATLKLSEEYTNYILALQNILTDAQKLILNLSRGYKTAARVDHEWRIKMKNVLFEFQSFLNDFTGGTPEGNQYFFDLPTLLKTTTPTKDNPDEDPCEDDEKEVEEKRKKVEKEESDKEKPWWERMGDEHRPFLVFGDMAEFKPPERREVLNRIKAAKTAPRKWKEYIFNRMYVSSDCNNADEIKDVFQYRIPKDHWVCPGPNGKPENYNKNETHNNMASRIVSQRDLLSQSRYYDTFILPSAAGQNNAYVEKTAILGARDSMEIASTTRLCRASEGRAKPAEHLGEKVVIQVGSRRQSILDEELQDNQDAMRKACEVFQEKKMDVVDDDEVSISKLVLKKTDSKEIAHHKPEVDHRIHYEKVCPVEKCQRLKADSFIRSLPLYMRANPFTHFEQTFEEYETCTPEQIAILSQRIAEKKSRKEPVESPLKEWTPSVDGVAVQTSDISMTMTPCTCRDPFNSPVSSRGMIYDLVDLIPVKQNLDTVNQECFYDDDIEFNRFKVIGQTESTTTDKKTADIQDRCRIQEITKILQQHQSLLEIFQGNAQCL